MFTTARDYTLAEAETWLGQCSTFFQMMAHLGVGGSGGGGGYLLKSHLEQHQPALFTGDLKLETVNVFLRKVKHLVHQAGASMGTTESDKHLHSAWRFMDPEAYSWFAHSIRQRSVTVIPLADGSYAPVWWPLFESAFRHHFVPEVAITAVWKQIRALRYSRGVGAVGHFSKHFSELIRMLRKETTITHKYPLYDKYCSKLPAGIADQILASASMQKKLQLATLFTLADTIEIVRVFSERTTSHLAITAMPVNHGANYVLRNTATVPMPVCLSGGDGSYSS